jgi:hypothetical protein
MTAPFDALDWMTMSQSQRDRGLDDGEAVFGTTVQAPEFGRLLRRLLHQRPAARRSTHTSIL